MSYFWERHEVEKLVEKGEIVPLCSYDFKCIHKYGYYGLFKPSIAEVLAQIDASVLDAVVAFEIIDSPKRKHDFYKDDLSRIAFRNGYFLVVKK